MLKEDSPEEFRASLGILSPPGGLKSLKVNPSLYISQYPAPGLSHHGSSVSNC